MATVLDTYLPFDSGPGSGVLESGWREMMKHMLGSASGVIRGFDNNFEVYADSSGMQVKIKTGQCWIRGHFGMSITEKTHAVSAAHATLARKDAVVLRCHFQNNNIEVDVVTGTPAGTPTLPPLTQNTTVWETYLAEVNVPAAAVTIAAGNVVDNRQYTMVFAKYARAATQNLPQNAFTVIAFDTVVVRNADVTADSTLQNFTLNRPGLWIITAQVGFAANATSGRDLQIATSAGTVLAESADATSSGSINTFLMASTADVFTAGTSIKVVAWHNTNPMNTVANSVKLSLMWVGP